MGLESNLRSLAAASPLTVAVKRLPTNTTTRAHPVHRWFNFIAGFAPELVRACVAMAGKSLAETRLLDPFSGCGTAPVAARLLGMSAVAYESHPFFAAISEAKANSPQYWTHLPAIHGALERGMSGRETDRVMLSESASAFLNKMFCGDDLASLLSARAELMTIGLDKNPLAVLILSRILDHCCFAATDGIYKAPTSTKRTLSPKEAMGKVFSTLKEDEREARIGPRRCNIYERSSESMSDLDDDSVDLVVTSPPYLNNFDFAEMTRMYLYFWGIATTWSEITDRVRSRLVVNTTTALKGHKDRQDTYRSTLPSDVRAAADQVVALLAVRRTEKPGKKEYDLLVYPYRKISG